MQMEMFDTTSETIQESETRRCNRCKKHVSVDLFSLHRKAKSGLQGMCQPCNQNYQQDIQYLRTIAPLRPQRCQCCGELSDKLQLDHDRFNVEFRGWLCVSCNTGIGSLGDDIPGLETAIKYLKGYYER